MRQLKDHEIDQIRHWLKKTSEDYEGIDKYLSEWREEEYSMLPCPQCGISYCPTIAKG